jgi:hypothetical protein
MYYYKFKNKVLISQIKYDDLTEISEDEALKSSDIVYALTKMKPGKSRGLFCVSSPSLLFLKEEGLNLLVNSRNSEHSLPNWILHKITLGKVVGVNTTYNNWKDSLELHYPKKWKVNIAGLGDVGSTLAIGLRLLGADCIETIGIFDKGPERLKRWEYELNQILPAIDGNDFPQVFEVTKDTLFNCDMFIFCISAGVPPVGEEITDVRLVQFQENSKIINEYAKSARNSGFKGIFAVVSDPVDLLCKSAFLASNTDENGNVDYNGLLPDQIRGYGLGVMHARAAYYARQSTNMMHYLDEGRAFGPHGEGLIIANSINKYDPDISLYLTEKALKANLEVRKIGFKPYVAPALSSGSLSIISTIKGSWHYSSTFIGGIYMGARNRLTPSGVELELLDMPSELIEKIENSYERLAKMYESALPDNSR